MPTPPEQRSSKRVSIIRIYIYRNERSRTVTYHDSEIGQIRHACARSWMNGFSHGTRYRGSTPPTHFFFSRPDRDRWSCVCQIAPQAHANQRWYLRFRLLLMILQALRPALRGKKMRTPNWNGCRTDILMRAIACTVNWKPIRFDI